MAKHHPKQKWIYYGLATAVGFSRVRAGQHFPSDVLAGAGLGIYAANNSLNGTNLISIKF
jgi:membrane-associated phospholipid phosphatase